MNGTRPKPRPGARTAPAALGLRRQNTGSASGGNINGLGSKQSHIKVTVRIRPLYLRPSSFVNDGDAPDSHFSSTTTLTSTQDSIPLSLSSHDLLLQQHHAHHRRTVSPIDEQLLVFDPIGPTTQGGTPADGEIPGTPARGRTIALGRRHKNMCYGFDRIFVSSRLSVHFFTAHSLSV